MVKIITTNRSRSRSCSRSGSRSVQKDVKPSPPTTLRTEAEYTLTTLLQPTSTTTNLTETERDAVMQGRGQKDAGSRYSGLYYIVYACIVYVLFLFENEKKNKEKKTGFL